MYKCVATVHESEAHATLEMNQSQVPCTRRAIFFCQSLERVDPVARDRLKNRSGFVRITITNVRTEATTEHSLTL